MSVKVETAGGTVRAKSRVRDGVLTLHFPEGLTLEKGGWIACTRDTILLTDADFAVERRIPVPMGPQERFNDGACAPDGTFYCGTMALDGSGRTLVRYSGTEKKIRVLVECPDAETAKQHADFLAQAVRESIGA